MYASRVRAQTQRNPCLSGLSEYLQQPGPAIDRSRVVCLDIFDHPRPHAKRNMNANQLCNELRMAKQHGHPPEPDRRGRILLIEDISKLAIEELGNFFEIDPWFFASYIDNPWRKTKSNSPKECSLPSRDRKQSFLPLHYHRTVSFHRNETRLTSFIRNCNHPRKAVVLPSMGESQVGLIQHGCSVLLVNHPGQEWTAIVLVDPPISNNYLPSRRQGYMPLDLGSSSLLGGCEDFSDISTAETEKQTCPLISDRGMLDELVYYWTRQFPPMFMPSNPTLQALSYYPLKIVAAEWVNYIFVLGMSLREHELSTSLTGNLLAQLETLNTNLRTLQGWRRRVLATEAKIRRIIRFLKNRRDAERPSEDWDALEEDYEFIQTEVSEHGQRLEDMVPLVTSAAALIESRRSLTETANVTRLTILALIFVPLSYVASLFSMTDDFGPGGPLFWVYFATAVPLAVILGLFVITPAGAMGKIRAKLMGMRTFRLGGKQ